MKTLEGHTDSVWRLELLNNGDLGLTIFKIKSNKEYYRKKLENDF